MNYILGNKEPKDVLRYFEEIAAIPHGSGNTKKISDYIADFAKQHELRCIQDELNNVIIFKGASCGYEEAKTVVLQGHMDMVAEKNAGVAKNMETEGLDLILDPDGDTLRADGTTLGADDGIAVAMMLAILADDSLPHPPVECVFTTDEETSMGGCAGLDCEPLKGRMLLNLDSESEGIITAGCAGGAHVDVQFPITDEEIREKNGYPITIKVSGLLGGHSGEAIRYGRASAVKLLGRILSAISDVSSYHLISVCGGTKDNAIPREAEVKLLLPKDVKRSKIEKALRHLEKDLKGEYEAADPDITITYIWEEKRSCSCLSGKLSKRVSRFLIAFPQGVIEYTAVDRTAPQTSLSLGILKQDEEKITASFLIRSSIDSQKRSVVNTVLALSKAVKADGVVTGMYPAWEYRPQSHFRDTCVKVYKELTGNDMKTVVIHGGVECGLLSSKMQGLDAVSIGPDTHEIHTPNEHISIASIGRTYEYVKAILKELQ